MSYRLTEAERKYVSTVDDTSLVIERVPVDGQTSQAFIHITDGDKLDLRQELPSYKFAVDGDDDKASRLRLIDTTDESNQIVCEGATIDGETKGLGWRYSIVFNKAADDEKYVDSIKLVRENDGKTTELTFRNINKLNVKTLAADDSFEANGKATFNSGLTAIGNIEVNANDKREGGKVSAKEIQTNSGNISVLTSDTAAIAKANLSNVAISSSDEQKAQVQATNASIDITNSTVTTDENTSVDLIEASINKLSSDKAAIDNLKVETKATISSADIVNKLTSENIETINAAVSNNFNAKGKSTIADATITKADIPELTSGTISNTGAITTDSLEVKNTATIDNGAVSTLTSENATIKNATITDTADVETLKAKNATVGSFTAETQNVTGDLNIAGDATVAGSLKVTGTTTVSQVKDQSGSSLILPDLDKSTTTLGSNSKQLILKTTSDASLKETDDNYGHIKAIVDNKETYLATMADLDVLNPLGVVDRYTNQTISGIKTFENQIVAQGGLTFTDLEDGHTKNIISHISNYNESKTITNEAYVQAKADAEKYDSQYEARANVYTSYASALNSVEAADEAKEDWQQLTNAKLAADTAVNNAQTYLDNAESIEETYENGTYATISQELTDANEALTAATNKKDAATDAFKEAKGAFEEKSYSYVNEEHIDTIIGNLTTAYSDAGYTEIDWSTYNNKENPIKFTYDANDIDSQKNKLREFKDAINNAIDDYNSNNGSAIGNTYYIALTNAKEAAEEQYKVNLYGGDTDEDGNSYSENNPSSDSFLGLANAVKDADDALTDATEKYNAAKEAAEDAKANADDAETALEGYKLDVKHAEEALKTAKETQQTAGDELTSANSRQEAAATKANADTAAFCSSYISYYKEWLNEAVTITELPETLNIPEVEEPENVAALRAGEIPENILDYEPNMVFLGDSEDELQIKSAGIMPQDGSDEADEHIIATIGGKYHRLANVDDVLTGTSSLENTVVTDVSSATEDKTVTISTVTEMLIKDDTDDEKAKNYPLTETIAQLKFGEGLAVEKNEDGSTSISADLSQVGAVKDVAVEDNALKVTKFNDDESKTYTFSGDVDISADGTNVVTKLSRFNDSLSDEDKISNEAVTDAYANADIGQITKQLATASDARLLHDDSVGKVKELSNILQTRLPVAPKSAGTYNLKANVGANADGTDKSVVYAWSSDESTLPEFDLDNELAIDENGNRLSQDSEYGLKLKYIQSESDPSKYVPHLVWTKLA